jgi:hypothetical protein
LILLACFLGIPGMGAIALVLSLQLPRLLYGEAIPILAAAEIFSLLSVVFLVFLVRHMLARPSAPTGFVRSVLDFLAMAGWHPAVKTALALILILPQLWFLNSDHFWLFGMIRQMGWRVLQSGDFHDELDRVMTAFQISLSGGVPLLFTLHLLTRWTPRYRWLPWLLIPVLVVGTAVAFIVLATIGHFMH